MSEEEHKPLGRPKTPLAVKYADSPLVRANPECGTFLDQLRDEDLFVPEMTQCKTMKQLLFVYHYFMNGFNAKQAAKEAGYGTTNANLIMKSPVVLKAINALVEKSEMLQLKAYTGIAKMADVSVCDGSPARCCGIHGV